MGKLQIRKGLKAALPTLDAGEPGLATDTKRLYVGNTDSQNIEFTPSAETVDYTVYVASSTFGGDTQANGKTGRRLVTGTTDATEANKLHDADGGFTSSLVGEAVYNSTDDTWTKVSAFIDSGELTLADDIFVSGESYDIASAVDNLPDAFNIADGGFRANIIVRITPETFDGGTLTLIGKTAGAAKTLTFQGSTTGTTTISSETDISQKIFFKNLTLTGRIFENFGADVDWADCITSGDDGFIITKSTSIANKFTDSTIIFESDPGNFTNISSTITVGHGVYVATTALGGTTGADGFLITQGTATSTTSNKLVDSTANFNTADHLNKTLYNSTDDMWAKITSIDSTTQVSLSANIMASGESYKIADAYSTVALAFASIAAPFNDNTIIRVSNGDFSDNLEYVGKLAAGVVTLSIKGSTTGTTTISGEVTHRQKIFLHDLTFTKRNFQYFGTNVDWTTCVTSGDDGFILRLSDAVANIFRSSSVVVFETDPGAYTNISSTVTIGFSIYCAKSTYGGDDSVADGFLITQGSATSTSANKLVDSTANFNATDHLNKTLFNTTDETWAKITAIDSTTQVSLSANIMASGESYKIVNAFSTGQEAANSVPGAYSSDVTVKMSAGTFVEDSLVIRGKVATGNFTLLVLGTPNLKAAGTLTSYTATTLTDSGASWGTNTYQLMGVEIVSGGVTYYHTILSHTGTVITLAGTMPSLSGTWTYRIFDWSTTINTTDSTLYSFGRAGCIASYVDTTARFIKVTGLNATLDEKGFSSHAGTLRVEGCFGIEISWGLYAESAKIVTNGFYHVCSNNYNRGAFLKTNAVGIIERCFLYGDATGYGVWKDTGSTGTIIGSRLENQYIGVYIFGSASNRMNSGSSFNDLNNCTYGIHALMNGVVVNGLAQTFTACTVDTLELTGGQIS